MKIIYKEYYNDVVMSAMASQIASLTLFLGKPDSETYPILGKSHNPGHPKRSGLRKHTLF